MIIKETTPFAHKRCRLSYLILLDGEFCISQRAHFVIALHVGIELSDHRDHVSVGRKILRIAVLPGGNKLQTLRQHAVASMITHA